MANISLLPDISIRDGRHKYSRILIGVIFFLIISYLIIFISATPVISENKLGKTESGFVDAIVVIDGVIRDGKEGMVSIRIKDGKEQFFIGNGWDVSFNMPNDFFIYKKDTSESGKYIIFHIQNGTSVQELNFSNIKGDISEMSLNKTRRYLLTKIIRDEKEEYCIMHADDSGDYGDCQPVFIQGAEKDSTAIWHPRITNIAILHTKFADNIFLIDAAARANPESVNQNDEQYAETREILDSYYERAYGFTNKLKKFGSLVRILHGNKAELYRIPIGTQVIGLSSGNILFKEGESLMVFDPEENETFLLFTAPYIRDNLIYIYDDGITRIL